MTPFIAVARGAATVRRTWPIWLLLWALTLAFALTMVLPGAALLYVRLGHSLWASEMLGNFDPQSVSEFLGQTGSWPLMAAAPLAALALGTYLLLVTFFSGGALTIFCERQSPFAADTFWAGCGRNFWRLVRLLLVSLACYGLLAGINLGLGAAGQKLWGEGMAERPLVLFGWARAGVTALLVLFLNMVFDYARIRLVAEDGRATLRTSCAALKFVLRHFGTTTGTYALICLLAAALATVYGLLSTALPRTALGWLLVVLLVQQAFVVGRVGVKLLFLAGQMEVHRAHRPRVRYAAI
jgi:hypothetical protein